jgi:GrpB-like predicted nucleotidyltransferase (UPF0157 family)
MTTGRTRAITVVDYDPSWPRTFAAFKARIWPVVRDVALAVEHVGSTAVPGLAAKPVIDIDVVVATLAHVRLAIERLATLGYVHRGDLGVADREAFASPQGSPAHHLYVCLRGSLALENHLATRDFLRQHPEAAATYGRLKKDLAERFPLEMDRYIDGKTAFVLDVLREAGLRADALTAIGDVNRRKT